MFTMPGWELKWLAAIAESHARGRKTTAQLEEAIRRCKAAGLTEEQVHAVLEAQRIQPRRLDAICSYNCPRCGRHNILPGWSWMDFYVCIGCQNRVKIELTKQ